MKLMLLNEKILFQFLQFRNQELEQRGIVNMYRDEFH